MNDIIIFQGKSNRAIYLIATVWNLCWFVISLGISMAFLTLSASAIAGAFWGNDRLHGPTFTAGILLYFMLLMLKIIYAICLRKAQAYRITNQEITASGGVFRKYHKVIRLNQIRGISYQRTVIQQAFNCGDIFISTSATDNSSIRLKNIDYVQTVYRQINQHR
jgi:uncharacterized membrane protein YdbT with pleckstrin-like domain